MQNQEKHIPVMLNEVIEYLNVSENKTFIDCTFGFGGYTKEILKIPKTKVIAFDRDPTTQKQADLLKKKYKDRFIFFNKKFSEVLETIQENNIKKIDGMVLDIGVSSMQIDQQERGFSFRFNSPLAMTMGINETNAFDVVDKLDETELINIFFNYGEENKSRIIAKNIVKSREQKTINTTKELVKIIEDSVGNFNAKKTIPKIFQAIRIYVNDELTELETILKNADKILSNNARLVVVTFHSLEDRIVKNFIKNNTKAINKNSRYLPTTQTNNNFLFKTITKNAIIPTDIEIKNNKNFIYPSSCCFIIFLFICSLILQQKIEKNNKIIKNLKTQIENLDIEINILNNGILNLTSIENVKKITKQNTNLKLITKQDYIKINELPVNKNL